LFVLEQGLRTLSFGPQDLTPPALRGRPVALLDNLAIIHEPGTIGAHAQTALRASRRSR
jgi:hypothetical protein